MQDFIKKYHKNRVLTNINIVLASLVLAFWINFLFVDNTNLWQNLKTSIIDTNTYIENKANLEIQNIDNKLYIVSNKDILNATNLSLSITYNPANVDVLDIKSSFWELVNISNTPWINSLILTLDNQNINLWTKIIEIEVTKKENKSENMNMLNANFNDKDKNQYLLSTSWITF